MDAEAERAAQLERAREQERIQKEKERLQREAVGGGEKAKFVCLFAGLFSLLYWYNITSDKNPGLCSLELERTVRNTGNIVLYFCFCGQCLVV